MAEKRTTRRFVLSAALAGALTLAAFGCGFEGGDEAELSMALGFGPERGWAIDTDDAYTITTLGIGEPLVRVGFDGEIGAGLAEDWEQVDETTWEFRLREGVTFHNDEELDASAAAGALTSLAEDSDSPPPGLGAEEVSYEAAGPLTLRVTTEDQDPILPQRLAGRNASIFAPEAYEQGWPPSPFGTGTGPFMAEEEPSGDSVALNGFDEYWGGEPRMETVEARFIEDPNTRSDTLLSGEVDVADLLPTTEVSGLRDEEDIEVVSEDVPRTTSLYTNTDSGPTSDPRVREAIDLAIDREALAEDVMEEVGAPAEGIFSPADPWAQEDRATSEPDPERARELLREAGYEGGGPELTIQTYPDRDFLPNLATALQSMLSEAGIDAEVETSEYAAQEPDVLEGNYDLFVLSRGYIIETNDAAGFLESDYTCEGSYNLNLYCSGEFDEIVSQLNDTVGENERYELFREAEAKILEDNAGVPLVHEQETFAHYDSVEGFRPHPTKHYLLTPEMHAGGGG